jgi:hypothetical protein
MKNRCQRQIDSWPKPHSTEWRLRSSNRISHDRRARRRQAPLSASVDAAPRLGLHSHVLCSNGSIHAIQSAQIESSLASVPHSPRGCRPFAQANCSARDHVNVRHSVCRQAARLSHSLSVWLEVPHLAQDVARRPLRVPRSPLARARRERGAARLRCHCRAVQRPRSKPTRRACVASSPRRSAARSPSRLPASPPTRAAFAAPAVDCDALWQALAAVFPLPRRRARRFHDPLSHRRAQCQRLVGRRRCCCLVVASSSSSSNIFECNIVECASSAAASAYFELRWTVADDNAYVLTFVSTASTRRSPRRAAVRAAGVVV